MRKELLSSASSAALARPIERGHRPPGAADGLPAEGYVRLAQIIGQGKPIPISRSSWWRGVRDGVYPRPLKLGPNTTVWRVEDIRALLSIGRAA